MVLIWPALLPVARLPLWQVAHVPAVTLLWSIEPVAGFQAAVWWQVSHDAVVEICAVLLPVAKFPLWQVAQVPDATLLWLHVAGFQAVVR